jgi:hypothetical protein
MKKLESIRYFVPVQGVGIHWKRIIVAGFLSELLVIAGLSAIIGIYSLVISPGRTSDDYKEFGRIAGYYLAAPAAALATFVMAFWAVRGLESDFVVNGFLVGVIATLLTLGFILGAKPEDRLMYVVSFAARMLAGYAAGVVIQKMKGH